MTRLERARSFDLTDKPFTQALLSRAAQYQDEAIRDVKDMGGTRSIPDETSLTRFAASCAATIAHHMTIEAAKTQARSAVFLPYEPVPKFAPMVVAFSLFVLAGIKVSSKPRVLSSHFQKLLQRLPTCFISLILMMSA
ncbi:MAG: hypothetical protein ACREU0_07330 [Burkholderiales bacterium]